MRNSLWRTGFAGVASAVLAIGLAQPSAAAGTALRTITYQGYQIDVPATWRVVDLAANPRACVRFDTETVYLGHQVEEPECPAKLVGRSVGLVLEPLAAVPPEQVHDGIVPALPGTAVPPEDTPSRDGTIQVAVEDTGVLVTAAHTEDTESAVRQVLNSARLVPGGTRSQLSTVSERAAEAQSITAPGTYLGKGFDVCSAPSQATMDAWRASPYRAIGIYSSGGLRACTQPNLTPTWVANQSAKGWRFILTDVGRQAPCTGFRLRMSTDPATARQQGRDAAAEAIASAVGLGFGSGSAIYSDIEAYSDNAACRASVLSYVSGWTEALHAKGWLSGVYSSGASGIRDLANAYTNPSYTRPDHIWFAWWNDRADVDAGSYAPASAWAHHQRIHQYAGDVPETWGGVRIAGIDRNYLDVGQPGPCDAVSLDFTSYPTLQPAATGNAVKAAQCLLAVEPTGTFDAASVAAATAFQQRTGLAATGVVDARTWTALLSTGDTPLLKQGSTGAAVSRLQRALTAALGTALGIDGDFGPNTDKAVRDYQGSRGLGVDGVVGPATWSALQAGR
ncbi:glycoside hydrolase domain-containing protein [Goodfellowiella coeruleoviolacea]|uniref:Peptidoglycan-binding (PGRP) domain of peptidoglycan hydrolases-containing protein n=1 Tax=Goodfellowiella coeruleoviolacea TaxID=334858 RepID=A0AAE3KMM2_9PSEU|nr:glycoside hydrolase domain-containing protein [Goodfellowiella coeruleoviolacea]MCP2167768.1 Peptidoglycan-binding (PGRP) domain of peptidoglycan hydrolases-containing protein [Goodfellowiella coeruleoviolacea]